MKQIAFIGSSPVMLLSAYLEQKKGNQVTLFEAADRLGGAWKTEEAFGHRIENGPHLFYTLKKNLSKYFAFFSNEFGITFEKYKPAPSAQRAFLGIAYPEFYYDHFNQALKAKSYLRFAGQFLFSLYKTVRTKILLNSDFEYQFPQGGSFSLIDKMQASILKKGGEILLNTHIQNISIDEKAYLVNRPFDKVLISARTHDLQINHHGKTQTIETQPEKLDVLFLKLWSTEKPKFSYFKFNSDSPYYIASDISFSAYPPLKTHTYIVSVALSKKNTTNTEAAMLFKNLVELGLLSKAAILEEHSLRAYTTFKHQNLALKLYEPFLGVIDYNNISRGIVNALKNEI